MTQLSFAFLIDEKPNLFLEEDFLLLEENSAAVNFFKKFFAQKDFRHSQFPSLIIKGAKACGKSHLLHIFALEAQAEFLNKEAISGVNPVSFFAPNCFYILENIDDFQDEELILRLINSAVEAEAFLILSVRSSPKFALKDLDSRLKNIFAVEIKNPSQESVKQLLTNAFSRKQIKISRQVIDFISDNIERSFDAVMNAVKMTEIYIQESGKNITVAEVKKFLKLQN